MGTPVDNETLVNETYSTSTTKQWESTKTMEHVSGIWGRDPMFRYLQEQILCKGDTVVDLGCGGGYPTVRVAEMVGLTGKVIGIEYSRAQLGLEAGQEPLSKTYADVKNVSFIWGDVRKMPLGNETMDKVVSFMVFHNLDIQGVNSALQETRRILKPGGVGVFLTIHPEILSASWDLDFWRYNPVDLEKYRAARDKEGVVMRGIVRNVSGGEKPIYMYNHTRKNLEDACKRSGFNIVQQDDLWIDKKTAIERFGMHAVKKLPTRPAFLMITVEKPKKAK